MIAKNKSDTLNYPYPNFSRLRRSKGLVKISISRMKLLEASDSERSRDRTQYLQNSNQTTNMFITQPARWKRSLLRNFTNKLTRT